MTDAKVRMVCRECGSTEVMRKASPTWTAAGGQWVQRTMLRPALPRCTNDTKIEVVPC